MIGDNLIANLDGKHLHVTLLCGGNVNVRLRKVQRPLYRRSNSGAERQARNLKHAVPFRVELDPVRLVDLELHEIAHHGREAVLLSGRRTAAIVPEVVYGKLCGIQAFEIVRVRR